MTQLTTSKRTTPQGSTRDILKSEYIDGTSSAIKDFLALRERGNNPEYASAFLADLILHPHLVYELYSSRISHALQSRCGHSIFIQAVSANILLGFIEGVSIPVLGGREYACVKEKNAADRIFALHDFACNYPELASADKIGKTIINGLKERPAAVAYAHRYVSIVSRGGSVESIDNRTWEFLVSDAFSAAQTAKLFLGTGLSKIAANLESQTGKKAHSMLAALHTGLFCLNLSRSEFIGFCARRSLNREFMNEAQFWSKLEMLINPTDGSEPLSIGAATTYARKTP